MSGHILFNRLPASSDEPLLVTSTEFENLVIQEPTNASSAFPFRALLEFVEASIEQPLQDLVILDRKDLEKRHIRDTYCEHSKHRCCESGTPHLHNHISQLQEKLAEARSTLRERETELATLRSLVNQQSHQQEYKPKFTSPDMQSDVAIRQKRRRLSYRSQNLGYDGADERMLDIPRQTREYSEAVSPSSARSKAGGKSIPPMETRSFAPGLAPRRPKVDEYDPLGYLAPKKRYSLLAGQEDAEVKKAWISVDPSDNTRSWDMTTDKQTSRSASNVSGPSGTERHSRQPSLAGSDTATVNSGWATTVSNPETADQSTNVANPDFEDMALDVDPEIRVGRMYIS